MELLRFLLFLPSVTFGVIPGVEVFPWALLYSCFKLKRVPGALLIFIFVISTSALYTTASYAGEFIFETVRSFIAYLNPVILFSTVITATDLEIRKLTKVISSMFFILIVIGILQVTDIGREIGPSILGAFVPRASHYEAFGGLRGVNLLSSEPSRAATELLFIYAVFRIVCGYKDSIKVAFDFLIIVFILIVIRSAVGLVLAVVYFSLIYRLKIVIPLILIFIMAVFFQESSRVAWLIVELSQQANFEDILTLFNHQSGFRVVSIFASYHSAVYSIFGSGVGAWPVSSINAMDAFGVDPEVHAFFLADGAGHLFGVRPASFLANLCLDVGIVGVFVFIFSYGRVLKNYCNKSCVANPLIYFFIFCLFFYGDVGNPVPWVALALGVRAFRSDVFRAVVSHNQKFSVEQGKRRDSRF